MRELRDKPRALPLFRRLDYDQVPRAVAGGAARGTVYVDSLAEPALALLWDEECHVYLAGDPSPSDMEPLRALLDGMLAQARDAGMYGIEVCSAPRAWDWYLGQTLPTGTRFARFWRSLYTLADPPAARDASPPAGYSLEAVDAEFLGRSALSNTEGLMEWLRTCWITPEAYLERGFGFCLMKGDLILSWCMAEYVTGGDCGIGVETHSEYRGRGFATLASWALAAECRRRGITPYWDCWTGNRASGAVAHKAGFRLHRQYPVHWVWL